MHEAGYRFLAFELIKQPEKYRVDPVMSHGLFFCSCFDFNFEYSRQRNVI